MQTSSSSSFGAVSIKACIKMLLSQNNEIGEKAAYDTLGHIQKMAGG